VLIGLAMTVPAKAQAPQPPPGQPPAAEAGGPARIVIASPTPIDTLDPHVVLDTRRAVARLNLYDALYRWLDGPVRVAPWLAQSYTLSEDNKIFRFTLRKDAKFHDGSDVKATDVVYSVERILALKRGVAPLLAGLVNPGSTKAIDAHTVEFSLSRPSTLFLTLLPEVHIVNAAVLKQHEVNNDWGQAWLERNHAGSGAYQLKSFDREKVVMTRFGAHWHAGWSKRPAEEVEVVTQLDADAGVEALIKGDVSVLEGPLLPHQRRRLREARETALVEDETPRILLGLMHSGREQLKPLAVRRALAQAFDTEGFIRSTLGPGAARAPLPLPPAFASPAAVAAAGGHRFDLAAARGALAKLKAPLRELSIGAIAGDAHSERAARTMLDGLMRLGVPARIVSEPWPAIANRMRDEKQMYDIVFLWRGARYLDPNNWIGEMYDCDLFGAGNSSWYCNKDVDKLIKEARTSADAKVRGAAYEAAAARAADDAAGIFIATMKATVAYNKRVKGLKLAPTGETIDLRALSLE
jgi:peptide/nickel transport system substrate-binding protein